MQGARFVGLEVGSNGAEVVGFVVGTEVVGFFVVGDTEVVGKYVGNPVVGEEVGFGSRLGLDVGWRVGRLVFTGFAVVGVDVVGVAVGEADSFEVVGVVVVRGVAVVGEEDGLEADGLDVVGDSLGVDVVGLEVGLEVVGVEVVGDLLGLEVIGDSVGVDVVGLDVGFNEVGKLVEVAVVGIEVGAVVTCIFREMADAVVSLLSPSSPCGFLLFLSLLTSPDNNSSIFSDSSMNEISSNSSFPLVDSFSPVSPSNIILNASNGATCSFCSTISLMLSLPSTLVESSMARHGPIPSIIHFRSIPGEVSQRFESQR